jgi:hypothetical protein
MHKVITNEALVQQLKLLKGNMEEKRAGWLVESPLLTINNDDRKMSCFVYMSFKKNTNVSNLYGEDLLQSDPTGCIFDFKNQLIIAMTTNENKLAMLEKQSFIPIQPLTLYTKRKYSADFPFWLSYILDKKSGKVTDNIYVKDFFAIASGREALNLSDAVSSSTKCTDQIETKLIFGINGTAKAASFKILAKGETYSVVLHEDGRVKIKEAKRLEELEAKAIYAEEIDNILGEIYTKYTGSQTEWTAARLEYKKSLLSNVIKEISDMIKT